MKISLSDVKALLEARRAAADAEQQGIAETVATPRRSTEWREAVARRDAFVEAIELVELYEGSL